MNLKKRQRRRHHVNNRNKHSYNNNNFLFPNNTDQQDEVQESVQCTKGVSNFQETSGKSLIINSFIWSFRKDTVSLTGLKILKGLVETKIDHIRNY